MRRALQILHADYMAYDPSLFPAVGLPAALGVDNTGAGGCYERKFYIGSAQSGLVEVNADSLTTCSYTVPSSGTWEDQFGATVGGGSATLGPAQGIVLVKQ